ncbi:MAG: hypothetical protein U0736_19555 [Gemmataceae bacterium]
MSRLAPPPLGDGSPIDPTKAVLSATLKHTAPLLGCRFDPTGDHVFAGGQDNAVVRWKVAGGKPTVFAGHKSWVRGLAFAAKERLVLSADYAGRVIAWPADAAAPAPRWQVDAHQGWVRALAVSPDGQTLASCGNDGLVRLWSLPDGKPVRTLSGHDCHVYNVLFHPDGRSLVSADLKGKLKHWDVARGAVIRDLDAAVLHKYDATFAADIGGVRGMAFDPAGKLLACAGITNVSNAFAGVGNPLVVLFDWDAGKLRLQLKPKAAFQGTAWGVAFHPQGFILAAGGGNGGALWAWRPTDATAFHTLAVPTNARDLALHPAGRLAAVACADGAVRLVDLTGKKG